jgi:hypothetical protein
MVTTKITYKIKKCHDFKQRLLIKYIFVQLKRPES